MGVKNLWDILESCKQTLPLHHLQNKRLCVDLSCWLIQLQNASKSSGCRKGKPYLSSLFHRLRALIALNCNLIFVTDGSIPSIKLPAYRRRLGSSSEQIAREDTNSQSMPSLRRNAGSEFSRMIKEAKVLGMALGIPFLDGLEEAEAQCASLNSSALCDGCFTSDSDAFLFGARTVYRDIVLGDGGYVTCYTMIDIERILGFGRNSLISLALLLGSDYSEGVHGFGRETACRIVKSTGDNVVLHRILSGGSAFSRKTKVKSKTAKPFNNDADKEDGLLYEQSTCTNVPNSRTKNQFLDVINAYLSPKCHLPYSEAVQRVCAQHPFLRAQLQQLCVQYFGWSPDQTDQYILPKIAERNLRRFANLRATSSELGVKVPLQQMPIPCPVATIIKQRKVHGNECFEVSWHEIDGLQTSIVPADLMESACPEKIAEFMEKKGQGKKQTRKPRKTKSTKDSLCNVDLQLQGLLLSAESENLPLSDSTNSHHMRGFSIASQCDSLQTTYCHRPTVSDASDSKFIDLSTPSPRLCACKVVKQCRGEKLHVDLVNLLDSETDASPEHERKARELRLFIDSIRGDLN